MRSGGTGGEGKREAGATADIWGQSTTIADARRMSVGNGGHEGKALTRIRKGKQGGAENRRKRGKRQAAKDSSGRDARLG